MSKQRWGQAAGLVVGLFVGGLWGVAIADAMHRSGFVGGPALPAWLGMVVLSVAVLAAVVMAAAMLFSRRRRPRSVLLAVGAVALVAGFAFGLGVG
jgi:hypothetical protein